jgi:hypothetical protein
VRNRAVSSIERGWYLSMGRLSTRSRGCRHGGSVAASRGAEQRGARGAGPVRCSGAVLLRAERNGATLLHLQKHSAARRTGLVHCAGPQGSGPARSGSWSRGASARLAWQAATASQMRKSRFAPKDQYHTAQSGPGHTQALPRKAHVNHKTALPGGGDGPRRSTHARHVERPFSAGQAAGS